MSGEDSKLPQRQRGTVGRYPRRHRRRTVRNLQATEFYRTLGVERENVARQIVDQEARIKADAGKEAAEHTAYGQLEFAAVLETQSWLNSLPRRRRSSNSSGKAFSSRCRPSIKRARVRGQLQDREIELVREHEDLKTATMDRAEMDRNQLTMAAQMLVDRSMTQSLTNMAIGTQSFYRVLRSTLGRLLAH